jgi:WD40 repeat protein
MDADRIGLAVLALALSLGAGCSESADSASAPGSSGVPAGFAGSGNGVGSDPQLPGGDQSDAGAPLPPETETDQSFRAPVATGKVLWSANPDSGRVALIDAKTLKVRMTNAGFGPTFLAAVPSRKNTDSAIVINVGSHDATWFTASATNIDAVTIPTHVGANAWAISAAGHFAIAWTDVTHLEGGAPDSVNGYSELTVIDLSVSPPTSTRLSVGFRPSEVVFDAAEKHAFAVVDEGISVLDLGKKSELSQLLTVSTDTQEAHARDVNFAPDGSFAVVRVEGSSKVEIIDLGSNERQVVELDSSVTDLDLSPDGKLATAVLGNATPPQVVSFTVPKPSLDTNEFACATLPGELVRSVTLAPSGELAFLYANAVPSSHLTLLDTAPGEGHCGFRTLDLQGPVQGVFVSPDSSAAIAFQTPPLGSTKKGLFSIVPTAAMRPPRIVGTDAVPTEIAFSDADTGKALVTVHDSTSMVRGVYVIGLANLEQNFVPLSSEPLPGATGIVAEAKRGFVAQKHPEGRITFIDLDTGVAQTLSGFEIAARVVQ